MILVVVPYYNSPETIRETVKSLLKQTYTDFELLIVSDADPINLKEHIGIDDRRIKYFTMSKNRGRYFIDTVASQANPHEFYIPTDADDVSDRNRLYYLVRKQQETNADAVFHSQQVKSRNGVVKVEVNSLLSQPQGGVMKHLAHFSGLYKSSVFENAPFHPEFRVGYDTLLVNLVKLTGNVVNMPRTLHTRIIRENSLTTSPTTGYGSPHRRQAIKRLQKLYLDSVNNPDKIAGIINSDIKLSTKQAVAKEVKRMRQEVWGL